MGPRGSAKAAFAAVAGRAGVDRLSLAARAGASSDSVSIRLPVLDQTADPDGAERTPEGVGLGLAAILNGVEAAMFDSASGTYPGQPETTLRLLLALERGYRLLAVEAAPPASRLIPPSPSLVAPLERTLASHRRRVFGDRASADYALSRAPETARFVADLGRAAGLGWWVDETGARGELVNWLAKVVSNPVLTADQRAEVMAELVEMHVDVEGMVEKALDARDSVSPGGRALLARALRREHPAEAASLLASAIGFARVSEDSEYAHCEIQPQHGQDWSLSGNRISSEILQSILAIGGRSLLAQPLANAIAVNRASGAWQPNEDTASAVRALVAHAEALATERGREALDPVAVAARSIFTLEREFSAVAFARDGEMPTQTPDTLFCAVGDTLRVKLLVRAAVPVFDVQVEDPTPAGCSGALGAAPHDAWRGAVTVRDSLVQVSPGWIRRGDTVLSHDLLVERGGVFLVPPARVFLANLPGLDAASAPLIIAAAGGD